MPRCTPSWIAILDRFLIDFCFQLQPTGSQKTWFFLREKYTFLKTRLSKLTSNFDPILSSTWLYFGIQNPPKSFQNRFQEALKNWSILGSIFNWFWLRFGGQLGAMLATFLGPRPSKRPPRPFKDASKTPPRRSKMHSKTPWNAQDGPRRFQTCPGALQTSIFDDFWSIFDLFLIGVWLIFDAFLVVFWIVFFCFLGQARWRDRRSAARWIAIDINSYRYSYRYSYRQLQI